MQSINQNVPNVPEGLKKDLDWYIAHQRELAEKYDGKILLIVDQQLIGAFDSMQEAYAKAVESHALGTFTLQPCSPGPESYTLTLYGAAYNVVA